MTTVGFATLQVIPSMRGIEANLGSGLAGPMKSAGSKAGKTLGESTKSGFGSAFGGAKGLIEGLGLFEAASKVKDFFTESIGQARETQKATAVTAARIKSTGAAAHVSAKQVTELGFALSKKTAVDHNVIQSGENMLLTFKNIRDEAGKGNDIFTQSTKTMVDLAAAMAGNGQLNPKTAAIQLGKALNDPVKGLTSLTRVGVQFTDQQKTQIAALVKSGHTMAAQKIILKELNSEFKGSAAAQATAGEKMTTAWHNLQDEVGTALLPILDKLETFLTTKAIPKVSRFVRQMQDGKGAGGQFADKLHSVFDAAKGIAGRIGDVIKALNGMPSWAKKLLAGGAVAGYAAKKLGITAILKPTLGKVAGGLLGSAKPVPVFVVNKGFATGTGGGTAGAAEKGLLGGSAGSAAVAIAAYLGPPIAAALGAFVLTHVPGQSPKDKQLNRNAQVGVEQGGAGSESGGSMGLPPDIGKSLVTDSQDTWNAPLNFKEWIHGFTDVTGRVSNLRATLAGLPKGVATKVEALGADASARQITRLANKYHLTPKEVRTLMKAQDYASPVIKKVIKGLDDTNGKHPNPRVTADIKSAMGSIRQTLSALGLVDKSHPSAKITVDNAAAMQALARTQQAINSLHGKTVINTVRQVGGSQKGLASGGPVVARQTYMVGENGPELFTSNTAGRIVPNHALRRTATLSNNVSETVSVTLSDDQFRRLEAVLERGSANGTARGMGSLTQRVTSGMRT